MQKQEVLIIWFLVSLFLSACGGGSSSNNGPKTSVIPLITVTSDEKNISKAEIPNNTAVQHYKVLFIGNSHVTTIPILLEKLIKAGLSEKEVDAERATGISYLIDRVNDGITYDLLKSNSWSHVILQAQKYSTSGQREYSTQGTETWIQRARDEKGATPILFPEHPQKGNSWEGQYVHNIHVGISNVEPACVAPIGLAWDRAIDIYPELNLHAGDGNHAALPGHFLSASVFYQTITGESVDLIPFIPEIDISVDIQTDLKAVASYTLSNHPSCDY